MEYGDDALLSPLFGVHWPGPACLLRTSEHADVTARTLGQVQTPDTRVR